jgi:amidase
VVGYKPTRDLITSKGIIYASQTQDTVGVLTRTVEDAGLLVQEIVRRISFSFSIDGHC